MKDESRKIILSGGRPITVVTPAPEAYASRLAIKRIRRWCFGLLTLVVCLFSSFLLSPSSFLLLADKDYSAELPYIPPREPTEALKSFRLPAGFRMELVAAEPLLRSPVALDFDENGRMFVVEYPEYNQETNKNFKGHGCVRLLEDTDGDGRFDKSTIYVDNLDCPVAVACYDGGIFVGTVPDILYCKDTDGDGRADVRQRVFTGFGRDPAGEAMLNSFRWGLDNRFHVSTSLAGGMVQRADVKDAQPISVRGQGFLFDPRSLTFAVTSGGGQHGMSMDDWGRTFVCANSEPLSLVMYDGRYLTRNPYLQAPAAAVNVVPGGKYTKLFRISVPEPWRVLRTRMRSEGQYAGSAENGQSFGFFTAATGVTVYRGDAWPKETHGDVFVGEVANNLIYRARLEPHGLGLIARHPDRGREFLASDDNWFRPVQFANAPDGTLYVIDMYRELIEGAAFLPPPLLKHVHVGGGLNRGRIYRIVPDGFRQPQPPRLGQTATAELVALLRHANGWHRDTAARLLYQRQDKTAVPLLTKMVSHSNEPLGRLHALYALDGLKALPASSLSRALEDADPRVREHAVRLAERFGAEPAIRHKLAALTADSDARVRYQLAFSLGDIKGDMPASALVRLAVRDGGNAWMRLAILSSLNERRGEVLRLLLANKTFRSTVPGRTLLRSIAEQIGMAHRAGDVAALIQALEELPADENSLAEEIVFALMSQRPESVRVRLHQGERSRAGTILLAMLNRARRAARDDKRDLKERVQAVRTLGVAEFRVVRPVFATLLQPRQPQPVQQAVLETLAHFTDASVPRLILDAWPGFSPRLRATATETLLARPAWIDVFFDAVARGMVKPGDIDPARIHLLQASAEKRIRTRAQKLFTGASLQRRRDVVAAYQKSLHLSGDVARGRAIFRRECAACHQLEGFGQSVGADLTAIRARGLEAVLLNILDPNREVKPQYLSYTLETSSGRTVSGMITAETANSITLRRLDGTNETVLRPDIAELHSTGMSFMPEGLEKQIDVRGMADLLAYLNSIK